MKASIECGKLRKIVGLIEPLSNELEIRCNDHWTIRTVDPAHVAMVDIGITSGYFQSYESSGEEVIRIPLEKVKGFNQLVKSSDMVEIWTESGKLVLTDGKLTRKIGLLDPTEDSVKVPKLNLPCIFDIESSVLNSAAKAGGTVSDHIEINVRNGKVTFLSAGDTDEMELSYNVNKKIENAKSLFPLDYFSSIAKAIPSSECVVKLGNDMPIVISFSDGEKDELVCDYLLAPRVESD